MPLRIEACPQVITAREAQLGKNAQGLLPDGPDAFDDRAGIRRRVLQR
jgi:hypothetical protein